MNNLYFLYLSARAQKNGFVNTETNVSAIISTPTSELEASLYFRKKVVINLLIYICLKENKLIIFCEC